MEWPKLKNMILVLLLITNFFLLAIIFSQEVQEDGQEQKTRQSALLFLADRGIAISEENVPTQSNLLPQQITWDRSQETGQATALLGKITSDSLGGDIISYHSPLGELRCYSNGEVAGHFPPASFPLEGEDPTTHGADILKKLGVDNLFLHQEEVEDGVLLYFVQTLEEIPLIDCTFILLYQQDSLVEIVQGRRLQGTMTPQLQPCLSVASSLMNFYTQLQVLGDVCSQVVDITPCYWVTASLATPGLLTPMWHITTDTGAYYLNTLTGELDRAT